MHINFRRELGTAKLLILNRVSRLGPWVVLVMALSSWAATVAGAAVTCYCDNAAVVYSFIKGASKCAEVNMMAGQCWLAAV